VSSCGVKGVAAAAAATAAVDHDTKGYANRTVTRVTADADIPVGNGPVPGTVEAAARLIDLKRRTEAASATAKARVTTLDDWVRANRIQGVDTQHAAGAQQQQSTSINHSTPSRAGGTSARTATTEFPASAPTSPTRRTLHTEQQQGKTRGVKPATALSKRLEKVSLQEQQASSAQDHSSSKCDDSFAHGAGAHGAGRRTAPAAAAAAAAGAAVMEDESEPAGGGRIRKSAVQWEDDGTRSEGDEFDTDAGDSSGSDSDEGDEGPDPAELIAKVSALGDGLALLHAKVDRLSAVLLSVLQAAGGGT